MNLLPVRFFLRLSLSLYYFHVKTADCSSPLFSRTSSSPMLSRLVFYSHPLLIGHKMRATEHFFETPLIV
ncbi:Protein CBG25221 [Caenorhabditis briggsae]|uniref:Protein CBG25221 n=1 Tax=Caenorhabditis briggsae TaxID=6238 RepID=B6IFJ1_CAEBR|nr:Protein CBG25221 [Caenorhabditis briggsae]CAR98671.1 Protein CBG25221 [Caenorhabditis briggsae]